MLYYSWEQGFGKGNAQENVQETVSGSARLVYNMPREPKNEICLERWIT